jgi:Helix-turn-helix domain
MRLTRFKIVYVGRGPIVPRDFSTFLKRGGYEVSRVALTAEEVKKLLSPAQSKGLRRARTVFTAEVVTIKRDAAKGSLDVARARTPRAIPMTLRALRERVGKTQGEVARRVSMTQPQLSRVEARRDHLISTLRKYVRALGGSIEVAARVKGARIILQDV